MVEISDLFGPCDSMSVTLARYEISQVRRELSEI